MSENLTAENLRLVESEQRYRAVIDNSSDMIQSLRPDGTFEFVNQAWLDKLAYSEEDLASLNVWDIIHEDSIEHCQLLFSRAIQGEPITYMEAVFIAKDGTRVPVEGSATSRFLGDQIVATHGFFRDISERIRAQELEERNRQLEREKHARYLEKMAALGKLSAGLAHELNNPAAAIQRAGSGLSDRLRERDAAMKALSGMGLDSGQWNAVERLLADIQSEHSNAPDLGPLEIDVMETSVEEWLEDQGIGNAWNIAPGLVQEGFTKERLEYLAQQVPEAALSPMLKWISDTLTVQESADIITRSSHRISELVSAIKGYSYMDRGTEQDADIHEGLDGTLIILAHRMRNMSVQRDYDRTLPAVEVFGNTLNQVWTNIIDNAIDATDGKGTILIRTRHEDGNAIVEIEDNGQGIAPSDLASIFEPFFTTKPQGQGMGLGLDNVWRIVTEEHCGSIDVESEPGRTVFRVVIPLSSSRGNACSEPT